MKILIWGIHISMKTPKIVRQHWVYMTLWGKREKRRWGTRFQNG